MRNGLVKFDPRKKELLRNNENTYICMYVNIFTYIHTLFLYIMDTIYILFVFKRKFHTFTCIMKIKLFIHVSDWAATYNRLPKTG